MKEFIKYIKTKGAKLLLIILAVGIFAFQAIALSIKPTNAEVVERVKQAELLATLNLPKNGNNEYLISTPANFVALSKYCTLGGSTSGLVFRQTVDIDLSGYSTGVNPVGTEAYKFKGTYHGDNHIISNFKASNQWNADVGLFGYVDGGTINNITVINADVWGKNNKSAGVIAGSIYAGTIIRNCSVFNSKVRNWATNNAYLGGIVGYIASSSATVSYCFSDAEIHSTGYDYIRCGGIAGMCEGGSTITRCEVRGSVYAGDSNTSEAYAGGIVGHAVNAKINNCNVFECDINARAKVQNYTSSTSTTSKDPNGYLSITKTTTTSNQEYRAYAGGIVGYANGANITETFVHSSSVYGGYKESTYSYNYATNSFAGIRGTRGLAIITIGYDYTYYNFSFNLDVYPETVIEYADYIVGYSVSNQAYTNNFYYGTSSYTGFSLQSADWSIKNFIGKKQELSQNFSQPSDTSNTVGTTSLNIEAITPNFPLLPPFYEYNSKGELYKYYRPLCYYCTNGSLTRPFQGQTFTGTVKNVFEMMLAIQCETIDQDGLVDLSDGEGFKLSLSWMFEYGWVIESETYTYVDTPMLGGNCISSAGDKGASFTASAYPNKLKSAYWSTDGEFHNGYPYLKAFYWKHGAIPPE